MCNLHEHFINSQFSIANTFMVAFFFLTVCPCLSYNICCSILMLITYAAITYAENVIANLIHLITCGSNFSSSFWMYKDCWGISMAVFHSIQFNFICIALLTKELCHKAALQRTGPQWVSLGQQWQGKTPWQITGRNLEQNRTQRGTICRWLAPVFIYLIINGNIHIYANKPWSIYELYMRHIFSIYLHVCKYMYQRIDICGIYLPYIDIYVHIFFKLYFLKLCFIWNISPSIPWITLRSYMSNNIREN